MKTNNSLQIGIVLGIGAVLFLTQSSQAQLYSNGNNFIAGNKVGIGSDSPTSMLTIKNTIIPPATCGNCISFPEADDPAFEILTVETTNPPSANANNTTHRWRFRADESYRVAYNGGGQSPVNVFDIGQNHASFFSESAQVTPYFYLDASGSNSNKYNLGFGAKSSGNNTFQQLVSGQSGSVIQSKNGALHFYTGVMSSNSYDPNLVVSSNGNVGIGVANPQAALDIADGDVQIANGDVEISNGSLEVSGNLQVNSGDLEVSNGRFVIGNASGTNNFEVKSNGYVIAREILVDINEAIPDYVFQEDYELMELDTLRAYIEKESHLPNIPSAKEFEEQGGIELGELTRLLLEKQEELVLYILELETRIEELETK